VAPTLGVVAAGHPLSAEAGADALRAGGNAVDAALGAMLTAFSCEPLLTGLGAGGYMLVVGSPEDGPDPVLLDFFVEAPGRAAPRERAELVPISVSFGDAVQIFNVGPASVGTYGMPAGVAEASRRFGRLPLAELIAPAARLAREGVPLNPEQAYVVEILAGLVTSTPECAAWYAPEGRLLRHGEVIRQPGLAEAMERLGEEGAAPFYTGDIAAAVAAWVGERGGLLGLEDLAAYRVIDRAPVRVVYRGREIVTNPPPSAGGILIARALGLLEAGPTPAPLTALISAMAATQALRTPEFLEGLSDPAFVARFLGAGGPGATGDGPKAGGDGPEAGGDGPEAGGDGREAGGGGGRRGSTTHVSVLDASGMACSVTCSNGASSGVVVPGTGLHLNNMLGEQDLNPLGFHRHPPGRRLPSMMAPTVVLRDGAPELVLGSAGSNRIRSAILQTILRVIDDGLPAPDAVDAPRVHFEDGVVYTEPGIDVAAIDLTRHGHAAFRARNLFFGGVQAVQRDAAGRFHGGGDPRRGGSAVVVEAAAKPGAQGGGGG
jgi:gamma-glutamyltranspeptidase/glutathione hydrolase